MNPPPISTTVLHHTAHRPYPLPRAPWLMRQRWLNLLFAHYALPPAEVAPLLPPGLELDTFDGQAWLSVVPFSMERVAVRPVRPVTFGVPSVRAFHELNLRTYVRSPRTGLRGVYFFCLECSSPLAVLGARIGFHLPYFPATMRVQRRGPDTLYTSRRLLGGTARFQATYGPHGPVTPSQPDSLAAFLTERYCLFTASRSRILRGDIHHLPWPLQPAWADVRLDELFQAHSMVKPLSQRPVLHFSRSLDVYIWPLVEDSPQLRKS